MASWFCKIGGKTYGPYGGDDLRRLVREGRLLPDDALREGDEGEWFAAREMENLFPTVERPGREDDDQTDDEFDRPRRRQRRGSGKPSNYYRILLTNFQDGGQWKQILFITFGLQIVIPTLFSLFRLMWFTGPGLGPPRGFLTVFVAILLGAFFYFILLGVAFFVDVLLFGLPCLLLRVRLNPRRDNVLDLFAYAYLIGLGVMLITLVVSCVSASLGRMLALLYPFIHAPVLAYLMVTYWGLPGGRAIALAAIRFGYQMTWLVLWVFLIIGAVQFL